MDVDIVTEPSLQLPNVLICPRSQYRLSKAYEKNLLVVSVIGRESLAMNGNRTVFYDDFLPNSTRQNLSSSIQTLLNFMEDLRATNCSINGTGDPRITSVMNTMGQANIARGIAADADYFPNVVQCMSDVNTSLTRYLEQRETRPCQKVDLDYYLDEVHNKTKDILNITDTLDLLFSEVLDKLAPSRDEQLVRCEFGYDEPQNCRFAVSQVDTVSGRCLFFNASLAGYNVSRAGLDSSLFELPPGPWAREAV